MPCTYVHIWRISGENAITAYVPDIYPIKPDNRTLCHVFYI